MKACDDENVADSKPKTMPMVCHLLTKYGSSTITLTELIRCNQILTLNTHSGRFIRGLGVLLQVDRQTVHDEFLTRHDPARLLGEDIIAEFESCGGFNRFQNSTMRIIDHDAK
jgi:hypothetical protein